MVAPISVLCFHTFLLLGGNAPEGVRYRLVFPGQDQGQEMTAEALREWYQWLVDREYDVAGVVRKEAVVDVVIREPETLPTLLEAGFVVVEEQPSRPLSPSLEPRTIPSEYFDPIRLETFLLNESAQHPTITNLTVIGVTHEGRNIYAMEVSSNPGVPEDKPAILLNGLHHSREVATPHVVTDAITFLTDGFEAGDEQVVAWMESFKFFLVPMVNPDGSARVHAFDDLHRKNLAPDVCSLSNPGVDLNRNYPYHWGSGSDVCERSPTGGSSGSECSDTYRGPGVGSEPETLAMIDLADAQRFLVAVSYHSAGQFIDYPYACNDGSPDQRMPEHEIIDELMHGAADAIFAASGVQFDVFSPVGISAVNGDDTSWYYAHKGTYPLIIEVATSFQPPFSAVAGIVARNRAGWTYLLDRMEGSRIDVRVVDGRTGDPLVAQVALLDFVFDTDELPRMTDPTFGRSRWLVPSDDEYTVEASATGYRTRRLNVAVGGAPVDVTLSLGCDGDANGDWQVDPADVGFVQARFGCSVGTGNTGCDDADQDGDGHVDAGDTGAIQARYGQLCPGG